MKALKFKCIKAWVDRYSKLSIMVGSKLELIEVNDNSYLLEVTFGISEGLQMEFDFLLMAEHFKIIKNKKHEVHGK